MSDGDEEAEETADETAEELDVDTLEDRLDNAATALDAAETEADLDDVEALLEDLETDIDEAELPEPDEDEEAPEESLQDRLSDLQDDLEEQRGPYAEDVVSAIEDAQSTLRDTEWTEQGESDLKETVSEYLDAAGDTLGETFTGGDAADPEALAEELDEVAEAVENAGLDPDEDTETIQSLVDVTDELDAGIEDAQEWDDLSVRQKLKAEGYYDVMGQKHKDFPPEWTALKQWEKRGNVEMVLLCLEHLGDTEFMERHCLDALRKMAPEEALDEVGQRAARRDVRAVEVVGKIGSEDGIEHIEDYVDADSNPKLQHTALKALGEIGSEESTQPVADQLAADSEDTRSQAARSLGLIGDTRAIDPLTELLAEDDSDTVRASAAWALVQIGTERALEAAAEYADDASYIVESEAENAVDALDVAEAPA
jgi:hypothetical protein